VNEAVKREESTIKAGDVHITSSGTPIDQIPEEKLQVLAIAGRENNLGFSFGIVCLLLANHNLHIQMK
jgi:hypothetical protein